MTSSCVIYCSMQLYIFNEKVVAGTNYTLVIFSGFIFLNGGLLSSNNTILQNKKIFVQQMPLLFSYLKWTADS